MSPITVRFCPTMSACGLTIVLIFALLLLPGTQSYQARAFQTMPDEGVLEPIVVYIEEDWQLVLNEPGEQITAPQFHTVMSPFGNTDVVYAQVSWNYRDLPEFVAGGMQLQAWGDDYNFGHTNVREDTLSLDAEIITWTQVLHTNGQKIRFKIIDGQSSSWGSFGGENVHVDIPFALTNLNGYSSSVSAADSCITYGSNRVTSLVITEVRRYGPNGLLSVDNTPVVVYEIESE